MCQFASFFEETRRRSADLSELSVDELRFVISQLPSYSLLTFTGGEPFVRRDILEILQWACGRNVCHIITNGTLVTDEAARRLASLGARRLGGKGLVLVGVSIQGDERLHDEITGVPGSFEKACRTVEMIRYYRQREGRRYPLINLKTVITRKTVYALERMFDLAETLGADICNLLTMNSSLEFYSRLARLDDIRKIRAWANTPSVPEKLDVAELSRQLGRLWERKDASRVQLRLSPQGIPPSEMIDFHRGRLVLSRYRCLMPWSKVFISAYGDVLICFNQWVGNVRDSSLHKLWMSPKMMRFRQMVKDAGLFPACAGCCQSEYLGGRSR